MTHMSPSGMWCLMFRTLVLAMITRGPIWSSCFLLSATCRPSHLLVKLFFFFFIWIVMLLIRFRVLLLRRSINNPRISVTYGFPPPNLCAVVPTFYFYIYYKFHNTLLLFGLERKKKARKKVSFIIYPA